MAVFPVTDYLLGQLHEIENTPITPLMTEEKNGKVDCAWVKREEVRNLATPFLQPAIDSNLLRNSFSGSSFLDQSVNAVTFIYTAKPGAASASALREITVYVTPESNTVERVYLVKESGDSLLQLTWKSGSWFSIRSISGQQVKEKKVKWNFDDHIRE